MAGPDVSIEPAPRAAAPGLTVIAHAAKRHWGYPEEWLGRWADTLTLTPEYIATYPTFMARTPDGIVGFYALILEPLGRPRRPAGAPALSSDAQLDHLWVLPAAMGRGIGRKLFEHAESCARENGATRLWVESDPHAEPFYRHLGMTVFGRTPAPMDDQARFLPLLEKRF